MIFINFKTYEQGTGVNAITLAKILEEVVGQTQIKVIPVVQAGDIREVTQSVNLEVWTQHIDPVDYGAHTGALVAESVKEDGAMGTFLNHSEHKFADFADLAKANTRALEIGLRTLIFGADILKLRKICDLKPTYVAYEPPELVGSKTTSVARAKPELIAKAVEVSRKFELPLIVGAGIKSQEDVRKSMELGAVGVAVASDIVAAKDPKIQLLDLINGFL